MTKKNSPVLLMVGGLLAALGAGLCCAVMPLLLMLGMGGSWMSSFTAFEPFRPYFMVATLALFMWAGWQVHRPIAKCPVGSVCAIPANRKRYQIIYWIMTILAITLVTSSYWRPSFA